MTWVAGEMCCLFSQNEFSGLRLAQQVVLTIMLYDHASSLPSRVLLSIRRSFGATEGGVVSFVGVAVVLSIRDIVFKNNNQCNNDNHYHQTANLRQAFL